MQLDTTTLLVFALVGLIITFAIYYYIIKGAVKEAVSQYHKELLEQLSAQHNDLQSAMATQNKLLALLATKGSDKKFALVDKDGKTKFIKGAELGNYPLQEYSIEEL